MLELATVGLALAWGYARLPAPLVERWFSAGVYPAVQRAVTPISNLVPFAVLDLLVLAAVAAMLTVIVRGVRAARRTHRIAPLLQAARQLVVALACGYLVFLALWGFNYRRVAMTDRLLVEREAPSSEAVVRLGLEAAARMNALHAEAHRAGWQGDEWRDEELRRAFAGVQRLLSDAPLAEPGRLKRTLFGSYFRWASVDGMVNPFGLEVLANPDLLPFERPFVAAHEWSHLAGYADEAEANFVGWLTCIRAHVPAQYSGWLYLFWQVNNEVDGEGRARLAQAMEPGPRADIDAIVARLRRGELPWLRNAGWNVYDTYLRANRVEQGVRSYGAVVTLILRARFEDGWTPVRRGAALGGSASP
ncbi:MAG: DUF3810 family protein [Acidobacteria bacterium]|nr:DUF3810 family protein [Acidobacteriota bacterium]